MSPVEVRREESSGRRGDVLRALKARSGPMSITEIAKVLDVHSNTVRFHLDTLVSEGRVEHVAPDRKRPGRPPLMFRAIPQMDRSGPRHYRLLAEILALTLASGRDASGKAQAAGRTWGREFTTSSPRGKRSSINGSVNHLVEVLDDFGFAPERRRSGGEHQIGLRHCPFLELAETRRKVVCSIHLGLMQGILESHDASVAVDRLDAFVQPDLCLAHLRPQGNSR
ncbi:transcriptional regulator [Mycobacterium paragordonae]|uniref:Helix-turn-helix domain-containing protein n=1 Tax=Mycobacterium paragordonae TaxID=1389713 RepID=A0A386U2H2_9MYCO|nr:MULTISPECIES: helix-turn-helix domain-containing protein [Mycobacterium]PJE25397.1 MAG: transcriptional regulator [Mycobacterium sp.]AYE94713.1 transcriptional regulator [Mycobacterium paragordonae]MDP7736453.1 helix-turn-helix domain-containing protein [Mycobacterium paragordonae]TDK92775.1 transcriptional regulator [Mycobacterium paragordonae]TDK96908.1 transcriptional regulator [Mycobacterium paragordonae]